MSKAVFLVALRFGESESSIVTMRFPSLPRFDAVAVENDIAAHMQERSATSSLNDDLLDVCRTPRMSLPRVPLWWDYEQIECPNKVVRGE
jgi:hypothetical protein